MKQWEERASRESRSAGCLVAGLIGGLLSLAVAAGWSFVYSRGVVVSIRGTSHFGFWTRLVVIAVFCLPLAWVIFRWEAGRELKKQRSLTICPGCETAGHQDAGAACSCGGTRVLASTVKWVNPEK